MLGHGGMAEVHRRHGGRWRVDTPAGTYTRGAAYNTAANRWRSLPADDTGRVIPVAD